MSKLQAGEICWNELATTDVNKAKEFYGSVFGWQFTDHQMGDMTYTMIKTNDKDAGGIWQIPFEQKDQIPPHWMAYILVDNAAAALEKAKQYGATIIKPVTQAGDMGLFAIIVDPTGAHIAIWQPLKK